MQQHDCLLGTLICHDSVIMQAYRHALFPHSYEATKLRYAVRFDSL